METFDYYFSIVKNSRSYSVWGAVFHPEYTDRMICKLEYTQFHGEVLTDVESNDGLFGDLSSILNSVV